MNTLFINNRQRVRVYSAHYFIQSLTKVVGAAVALWVELVAHSSLVTWQSVFGQKTDPHIAPKTKKPILKPVFLWFQSQAQKNGMVISGWASDINPMPNQYAEHNWLLLAFLGVKLKGFAFALIKLVNYTAQPKKKSPPKKKKVIHFNISLDHL